MDVQADIGHIVKVFAGNKPDDLGLTFLSFVSSVT
jgi:hypothetical protein